ncbi:MAG TPA: DUF4271 domain-containing protein [Bacteroidia bacterium]|nr:DUF4271 domain-containing protein [Bacteroidia bacterium]
MLILLENIRPNPYIPNWIIIVLLIQISILFYIYIYSPRILLLPFLAIADKRVRRELMESKNSFQSRLLMLLNLVFYLSFSLMLYLLFKENNFVQTSSLLSDISYKWRDVVIFSVILFAVMVIVALKKITFISIAYIFDEIKRFGHFIFSMDMFLRTLGIVFFILNFAFVWELIENINVIYFVLIFNTILYILLLLFNFIEVVHKTWIDYLNFILYFCALELIPFLFILKILSR